MTNTAEIARFILEAEDRLVPLVEQKELTEHDLQIKLLMAVRERFGKDLPREEYMRALHVALDELDRRAEAARESYKRTKRQLAATTMIHEGLPAGLRFREACQIRATGTGPVADLAQQYLTWFDSREYRVREALVEAAMKAHPYFERDVTRPHIWHYTAPGDGPDEETLIDWFQRTHPARARAVEAEIQ